MGTRRIGDEAISSSTEAFPGARTRKTASTAPSSIAKFAALADIGSAVSDEGSRPKWAARNQKERN